MLCRDDGSRTRNRRPTDNKQSPQPRYHHRAIVLWLVGVLFSFVQVGSAQPLDTGQTGSPFEVVYVTFQASAGGEMMGRLVEVKSDRVVILIDGQRREFRLDRVARIERAGDSVKNGTIIGAVILGGLCALTCGQGLDNADDYVPVVLANAGAGALVGMVVDAAHKGRTTIYPVAGSTAKGWKTGPSLVFRMRF